MAESLSEFLLSGSGWDKVGRSDQDWFGPEFHGSSLAHSPTRSKLRDTSSES